MFSEQSMCTVRETAHYLLEEDFSIAITDPWGLSARFPNDLTTGVAGSEKESGEKPSEITLFHLTQSRRRPHFRTQLL